MRTLFIILLIIVFFKINFAQNAQKDSIYFTVRIGGYRQIPDAVKQYISSKNVQIIPGVACYDATIINKIHVGNFNCYKEAKKFAEQAVKDGYKDAFVVAFNRKTRIKPEDAIKKTKKTCK